MDIIHDKDKRQFILPLSDGLKAKVEYILDNSNDMRLVHSEVPYELRGQGVGKDLVLKTFEKLTEEGYTATAICSYIRAVAKRHPTWSSIIS
ncbi:MAG: GNAT family N-acetyltransferase [Flavobacteriales bacterium]